ncbi:MAG: hypothetical protein KAS71_06140, partial [Bacteroidales bacterium]|nr:hypothetical protein [Bacteroidales bacterium]
MYNKILIGIFIAVVSALIAGLTIEYVREHRAIPFIYEKSQSTKAIEDNLPKSKSGVDIILESKNEEYSNQKELLSRDLDNVKFTKES